MELHIQCFIISWIYGIIFCEYYRRDKGPTLNSGLQVAKFCGIDKFLSQNSIIVEKSVEVHQLHKP
jgi:hypothetical protein